MKIFKIFQGGLYRGHRRSPPTRPSTLLPSSKILLATGLSLQLNKTRPDFFTRIWRHPRSGVRKSEFIFNIFSEPFNHLIFSERNVLESKIQLDTIYQKQQGTLIVWSESETCDLALSFQEKTGCTELWEKICR